MNEMLIDAKLIKAVSQKTGNEYVCVEITLPNGYKTRLFFNRADSFLALSCFGE